MRSFFLSAMLLLAAPAMADDKPWTVLFDGRSLSGWTSVTGGKPGDGWKVESDGVLRRAATAGDLISEKEYADFELEFQWSASEGTNSGVKYRLRKTAAGWVGPEYQVLDDARHKNGKVPKTAAASLYEVLAPDAGKVLKPAGEWNESRVVARGAILEHWLNGKLVLRADTASPEWAEAKKKSKFAKVADFAAAGAGKILIQDHGDEVRFRQIRIRTL